MFIQLNKIIYIEQKKTEKRKKKCIKLLALAHWL